MYFPFLILRAGDGVIRATSQSMCKSLQRICLTPFGRDYPLPRRSLPIRPKIDG